MFNAKCQQLGRTSTCYEMARSRCVVIGILLVLVTISCHSVLAAGVSKKIIEFGWDSLAMTPQILKQHITELNDSPFDGIAFNFDVNGDRQDMTARCQTVLANWAWDRGWFAQSVSDLQAASKKSPKMKNSFLVVDLGSQKRGRWSDDTFWANAATNFGIVAYMAKQGGLKGMFLDPEGYSQPAWFTYDPAQGDYDTQCLLARKRGAQIMTAMAKEYPDITVLSFLLLSYSPAVENYWSPVDQAKADGWLLPAFLNGMLDALPSKATLVDGDEVGYYNTGIWYDAEYYRLKETMLPLVAPENRAKYTSQVKIGFGQYVDLFTNPPGHFYLGPLPGGTRLSRFIVTMSHALSVSDEYIWVYGEQGCWWRFNVVDASGHDWSKMPLWETRLPGVTSGIRKIKRSQ